MQPNNLPLLECLLPCQVGVNFMFGAFYEIIGSRALSFSDPKSQSTCLSVVLSFCHSVRVFNVKLVSTLRLVHSVKLFMFQSLQFCNGVVEKYLKILLHAEG